MKRKFLMMFLAVATLLCMAFGLAGCDLFGGNGGENADNTTDAEQDSSKPDGGDKQKWTEGLEYQEVEDENGELVAVVTGIGDATDTDLVIPSTYHGLKVTTIGRGAFAQINAFEDLYLFSKEMSITSVVIPDSVTSIEDGAFAACFELSSVTLGKGVASIGLEAFIDSPKIVEIWNYSDLDIVPGDIGNGSISYYAKQVYTTDEKSKQTLTDDGFLFYEDETESYLLGYRGKETELTLPAKSPNGKNYAIYQTAFGLFTSLRNVVISDGVTAIENQAFGFCLELTGVTVGKNVAEIDKDAFLGCDKITEVWNYSSVALPQLSHRFYLRRLTPYVYTTDVESKQTTTSDGYIFFEDGDKSYLIGYCGEEKDLTLPEKSPSGKDYAIDDLAFYCGCAITRIVLHSIDDDVPLIDPNRLNSITIPDSVTEIGLYAFEGCSGLTSITVGRGVTSIGYYAFYGCSGLTSLEIPDNVTSIGDCAFEGCSGLTDIQFKGTVEEWQAIQIDGAWDFNTGDYTITCTDGTIDKEGNVTYFEQ